MELQVPYSICAEISAESIFRREAKRNPRNIAKIVRMERGRNHRRGGMPGSHTYVGEYTTQNERFGIYGIFEREELLDDISKMGEHEVRIPKPRILVQRILRRYRGEEHESDKGVYRGSIEKRSRE